MKASMAPVLGFCLFALSVSKGASLEAERMGFEAAPDVTPVVVFGVDQRASVEDFAHSRSLDAQSLRRRYAGTGLVRCGNAQGSGQLTLSDDVITTAAHVIYDRDGHLRGDSDHCKFVVQVDGQEISAPLEVNGAIVGSTNPYNEDAVHDWAVVKLARPLQGAEPYALAPVTAHASVLFVARGAIDWFGGREMSMQLCQLRDSLASGAEGTREFSFDCAANVGASGSGLLDGDGKGLLAIFVGYRSVAPDQALPFSSTHYNFAITVEGAFRQAVEQQGTLGATASAK